MSIYVQIRRALAATWTADNPVLLAGQMGYETDTGRVKIGDGTTAWTSLAYRFEFGSLTDGDKGDVIVSGGAATLALDYTAVNATVAPTWANVTGKPSTFAPSAHTHALADLTISGATSNQVPQWNGSAWVPATISGGGGISDGDKGDIVVSGTGTVWSIDYTAVNAVVAPTWANVTGKPAAITALSGTNTGDQASIVGITGTKAQFDTAVTDGNFLYVGDAPTSHTHTASAITDFAAAVAATASVTANTAKVSNANHTGDATGDTALTLATVNANVGSFGSATQVATFTTNAKGLTTAAGNTTISVPATAISDSTTAGRAVVTAADAAAQTALLDVATSSVKGLAPASGGGTTNFLRADLTWASPGGGGGTPPDIQEFSTPGSSNWTKPAGAVMVHVTMFGAGGGGGGGRLRADTSTAASGGGGGGGGGFSQIVLPASGLAATVTVVIGSGGTAGLGRNTTEQNGGAGGNGGATSFGAFSVRNANGGPGGPVAAAGGGSGGGTVSGSTSGSGFYNNSGAAGALGAAGVAGNRAPFGGGSGAGGPGFAAAGTTAQAGAAGGLGGATYDASNSSSGGGGTGGTASGGDGGAGAAGASSVVGGSGGGSGGNGGTTANGGAGGAGGNPGGGGGGGGAATLTFASGAGGAGGNGFIRVTAYF